ncbi:hypothetical protein PIB30_037058 [Stylosanthes scabra]|uniref:Uncharacterized protein n=1 Tax=Stylosanthes scabra TaxID=79078 RepID=A0ABU6VFR7_9FABA|nr:hypothetical protein [Stylosanthes scabra]
MGSGVIYYEYEECEKFEDYGMKADIELGTFKIRRYRLDDEASVHPLYRVGWVKDTIKRESEGWNPLMRKRMLSREIPRKRFLLHFPYLWTSMRKKNYLRHVKELKRRPELSPLCQTSFCIRFTKESTDRQPAGHNASSYDPLEFGNRHCRV